MKIIKSVDVPSIIHSGDTIAVGGFGAYGCPDELLDAVVQSYKASGSPNGITWVTGIGTGDNTENEIGMNRVSIPGMTGCVIAAHLANCVKLGKAVGRNEIPAYVIPLGVVAHLMRSIAAGEPGVASHVGIHTLADPRNDGCCSNQAARDMGREVVKLIDVAGKECLFYPSFPIQVAFIRATYADEDGNLSFDHEALTGMELEMALAAHNSGGIVIAQVEKIVKRGTLKPKTVRVHRKLVDYVLVAKPEFHHQGYATDVYRPELTGEIQVPTNTLEPLPFDTRKIATRRAAMELKPGMIINLGIGMPSGVGAVANEEGIGDTILSLESGPIGGVPVAGLGFAASVNAECIMSMADTFDFYDGGGLDMTCLGAAEIDKMGNVNVSSFNGRCTGPGGFINISQSTPEVIFLFAFTAGKNDIIAHDGKLEIRQDGKPVKFVKEVGQVTFSAQYAQESGQKVLYITERAVFRLTEKGLELIEIAPGVDLQKNILEKMDFEPIVSPELRLMDERIFREEPMGLGLAD
ncbi:MAG: 3-oxoacid CoA-transferase [Oscillospiraceae bacterium]|nr:3-oxoacid CoA-transferase [Oscillospiraceae bacterium]